MSAAPPFVPSAPTRKPIIMIVGGNSSCHRQIRTGLENGGFSIVEAASGSEAIESFRINPVDLIFLDVDMPAIDGFATCQKIRLLPDGAHLPVVAITDQEDAAVIAKAFHAGATDFISRSISPLILGFRVDYWLRSGMVLNLLQTSQTQLFKAQDIARLGHWERDLDRGLFKLSCHCPELIGLDSFSTYESLFAAIVADERDHVEKVIANACANGLPFKLQYRIALADGSERTLINQGEIVTRNNPKGRLAVGIIQDISELKWAEDKIRYLALYDNLTGLANRMLFREHWTRMIPDSRRRKDRAAVFLIDLDHFNRINDSLGHPSGDQALMVVAERLGATLRQSDIIARPNADQTSSLISRIGGDEFSILATGINSTEHIANLAKRIGDALAAPIELETQPIHLTASIGISIYPDDGDDIDTLLKNADTAMHAAKDNGRNNCQFFQKAMNEAATARFRMSNSLSKALANGEFVLYYQPQFSNCSSKLTGVEALIRWIDPKIGLIPPDNFLPFAEENGFIHQINEWVIQEACSQAQQWVEAGVFEGCRMGINISGANIKFDQLGQKIAAILAETGLLPEYLELELTERVMMVNTSEARKILLNLKEMGVSIAIDDFGTGYSALSHLQLFPLSTLKIDKSFIANLESDNNGLALLHSIIGIAKSFNLKVVAEGVETEKQRLALGRMDCDDLQGYLLCRPIPKEKLEEWLLKRDLCG